MISLLTWLNIWIDDTCPSCQEAVKAIKNQKGGESLQLRLKIIKDMELCPMVHIEIIDS